MNSPPPSPAVRVAQDAFILVTLLGLGFLFFAFTANRALEYYGYGAAQAVPVKENLDKHHWRVTAVGGPGRGTCQMGGRQIVFITDKVYQEFIFPAEALLTDCGSPTMSLRAAPLD